MTEIGFQIVHDEAMSEDPRIVEDYYETTDQHFEQRAASWCFEVQGKHDDAAMRHSSGQLWLLGGALMKQGFWLFTGTLNEVPCY